MCGSSPFLWVQTACQEHVSCQPQCMWEAGDGARLSVTLSVSLTSSRFLRGCPHTCTRACSSGFTSCGVKVIFGLFCFVCSNFLIGLCVLLLQSCPTLGILWTLTPGPLSMGFSPSKNTGVVGHALQGIFPTLGIKPKSPCSPCIPSGFFTTTTTREALNWLNPPLILRCTPDGLSSLNSPDRLGAPSVPHLPRVVGMKQGGGSSGKGD